MKITMATALKFSQNIAAGMQHLASHHIVHGDLAA